MLIRRQIFFQKHQFRQKFKREYQATLSKTQNGEVARAQYAKILRRYRTLLRNRLSLDAVALFLRKFLQQIFQDKCLLHRSKFVVIFSNLFMHTSGPIIYSGETWSLRMTRSFGNIHMNRVEMLWSNRP